MNLKKALIYSICFMCFLTFVNAQAFRPPAVPLVTIDPYTSCWSFGSSLVGDATRHWTGRPHSMTGIIRVDGQSYGFMGRFMPPIEIMPTGEKQGFSAKFTNVSPSKDWILPGFDDSKWKSGQGGFGYLPLESDIVRTTWEGKDIWVRREFTLNDLDVDKMYLLISHDEGMETYINGVLAARSGNWTVEYLEYQISPEAKAAMHKGKNIIAIHCENQSSRGFLDVALLKVNPGLSSLQACQTSLHVSATQSKYKFRYGPIDLQVTFTSPLLMDDLDVLSRPASYVTFNVVSNDKKSHDVQVYFDMFGEWSVNFPQQKIAWKHNVADPLNLLSVGTTSQNILGTAGDNVRIDWGYAYLAVPRSPQKSVVIAEGRMSQETFSKTGRLLEKDDLDMPRAANDRAISMACVHDFGKVSDQPLSTHIIVGYDDLYSIEYFGTKLKPWWRRDGKTEAKDMMLEAEKQYESVMEACTQFDNALYNTAKQIGGEEYARICALVYRQTIAAHKLVASAENTPLFFSKENFSNGSIGTVDVNFPSSPLFLIYNTTLLKGELIPIFKYAASKEWPHNFSPHDVGTYPLANGQTYNGTRIEGQMPVEECGNMLILAAAISKIDGNTKFAQLYWDQLTLWAQYLRDKGLDPGNQLCTADMFGEMAHNADLSLKAIIGLGGYALMADMLNKKEDADAYWKVAKEYAAKWQVMAKDEKWNTRLAFDQPDTWGMKHNLVWDRVLGMKLFPDSLADGEVKTYYLQSNTYGFPNDNRTQTCLIDWALWSACLARNKQDFSVLFSPFYKYANETPSRVPLSDWFYTTDGKQRGFQNRSVVGGIFIRFLAPSVPENRPLITDHLREIRQQFRLNQKNVKVPF